MSEYRGPVNVNVNVSQSQNQEQSQDNNGCIGCGVLLVVSLIIGGIGSAFEASPVLGVIVVGLILAAVVVVALAWIGSRRQAADEAERERVTLARAEAVRAETEGRAAVDAGGGCMWCGQREAHRAQNGHPLHPREWHALEVEEAVRAAGGTPPEPADDSPGAGMWRQASPAAPAPTPGRSAPASDLEAQLAYTDSGECLWCGAPSQHRTPEGRVIHPARVHQQEYERERSRRGHG